METGHAGRILVGVDGTAASVEALRCGARLALSRKMRLEAVTAWFFKSWMIAGVDYSWEFELEALQTAADSAQQVFGDQWPDWFQISLVQGPAAQILISESARANLLIVGTRDHSRLVRCLLGSISAACRKRARCPVLVMHDKSLEATGRNTLSA